MLTRIEIDGFKTFEKFGLDLKPLTAIVGPNASGKSNLFDALRFLSLLAQFDIRTAMQDLRGEPEELFRKTPFGNSEWITFAVEALLSRTGVDAFGMKYEIPGQRIRYELKLKLSRNSDGNARGVFVSSENCFPIAKKNEKNKLYHSSNISYSKRKTKFIETKELEKTILLRQDGHQKRGNPAKLSLEEASRTALSTITTAEFPHLYAFRDVLTNMRFLEINPGAARNANDRFEGRILKPDASNLSAVLARIKEQTATELRPNGVLSDIASDLASLIPSVSRLEVQNDVNQRQYSFRLGFSGQQEFSSRVISDGTLRLLALLTVLHDPDRRGTLCFEEPENGIHEGRVALLVKFLRNAANETVDISGPPFQILINTHSPKVMAALEDNEIVVADSVTTVNPITRSRSTKTRMRTGVGSSSDLFNPEINLSRFEVDRLLQRPADAA